MLNWALKGWLRKKIALKPLGAVKPCFKYSQTLKVIHLLVGPDYGRKGGEDEISPALSRGSNPGPQLPLTDTLLPLTRPHFLISNRAIFSHCNSLIGGSDFKLIYRHYATLFFVFCVDSSESELGILDLIQAINYFCNEWPWLDWL